MASSPPPHASLVRAAAVEDQRVERALQQLSHRRETLAAELANLDNQMNELRERQRLLGVLVDGASRDQADQEAPARIALAGMTPVRGRALRLVAAQLLWRSAGEQEIYYREWFERLLQAGYAVGGRDPLASFLTNVRDSPAVARGQRQGFYRLDPTRQAAATRELSEVQAEMADLARSLQQARATNDNTTIERLREHRNKLAATIKRLEAQRDELAAVFTDHTANEDASKKAHAA
jgi:septal ring factor EnvC (AmiA/AmiB activator)